MMLVLVHLVKLTYLSAIKNPFEMRVKELSYRSRECDQSLTKGQKLATA